MYQPEFESVNESVGLKITAMAGNRTQVNCLEGSYAYHYTTIATVETRNQEKILES